MGNKYDEYFDFKTASVDDTEAIMQFIRDYWDAHHILGNDRGFFLYHYRNLVKPDMLNIDIFCGKDGEIAGINGFVETGCNTDGRYYLSGSLTKMRADVTVPMAGLELMKRSLALRIPHTDYSFGTNPVTMLPLYEKVFQYNTGIMDIWYMLHPMKDDFKLIKIPEEKRISVQNAMRSCLKNKCKLRRVFSVEDIHLDFSNRYPRLPLKSKKYVEHRYFKHPVFKYMAYEVENDSRQCGIVFFRKAEADNSSLLILSDFIGDIECFKHMGSAMRDILIEHGAEGIHLMEHGLPEEYLEEGGFSKVELQSDSVVVPTYFEPFVKSNVAIRYVASEPDLVIFKAAGDQDNPRLPQTK